MILQQLEGCLPVGGQVRHCRKTGRQPSNVFFRIMAKLKKTDAELVAEYLQSLGTHSKRKSRLCRQ